MNLKDAFTAQRSTAAGERAVKDTFVDLDKLPESEISKLTIRLAKSLHKEVKAQAIADDISVQDLVIAALERELAARKAASQ